MTDFVQTPADLRPMLMRFVSGRVADAEAEDLVQDILLRVHRGVETLRDRDRFVPWLHRIARNALKDHYRSKGRRKEKLVEAPEPSAEPIRSDGEREVLLACLRPMAERLEEKYARAVRRVELDGLSQADAAAEAGISLSGMKSRVQRGRAMLKEELLRCCAIELDRRGGVVEVKPQKPCGC